MLTPTALFYYRKMLRVTCSLRMIPYVWDSFRCRLKHPTLNILATFRFHKSVIFFVVLFSSFRLAQNIYKGPKEFPLFVKVLNIIWVLAAFLTSIVFIQLEISREQIMESLNNILQKTERNIEFNQKPTQGKVINPQSTDPEFTASISRQLLLGLFFLATNPAGHAGIIAETPCAPQFISSLILPCSSAGAKVPYVYTVPFFFFENYVVTLVLVQLAFSWSVFFLGFGWILGSLQRLRRQSGDKIGWDTKYRELERMAASLNSCLWLYLSWYASIMFGILALLIFGCIRLLHLDLRANVMFPGCALRCGFEALSPMRVAGEVHRQSEGLLADWRCGGGGDALKRRERASWKCITAKAGSSYTFESSIVLVSLNNLIQLTLNMLVAFAN